MMVPDFENSELEKLAQMVARGFEAVDKRFDEVDARLRWLMSDLILSKKTSTSGLSKCTQTFRSLRENAERVEAKMDAGFKSVREDIDALAADHFPLSAQPS